MQVHLPATCEFNGLLYLTRFMSMLNVQSGDPALIINAVMMRGAQMCTIKYFHVHNGSNVCCRGWLDRNRKIPGQVRRSCGQPALQMAKRFSFLSTCHSALGLFLLQSNRHHLHAGKHRSRLPCPYCNYLQIKEQSRTGDASKYLLAPSPILNFDEMNSVLFGDYSPILKFVDGQFLNSTYIVL